MLAIKISSEDDVYQAVSLVSYLIRNRSFDEMDRQSILISVLEVTRNVLDHAGGSGLYRCEVNQEGFRFECRDKGRGIDHIDDIIQGKYQSPHGLGLGLAGVNRLMDELSITTSAKGTEIVGIKRERRK